MQNDQQPPQLTELLLEEHENLPEVKLVHNHSKKYNPYASPPDLDLAMKHGKAKRVYYSIFSKKHSLLNMHVCPCCGLALEGDPIPLMADLSDIYHLGSGYALYFRTIRYCIALLCLMLLVNGLYNISSNADAGDCTPADITSTTPFYCVQDFISTYTISNKKDDQDLLDTQMILNLACVVLMMFYFQFVRYQTRKIEIEVNDQTVTPADYTLKISGIDPNTTDEKIKEWVESLRTTQQEIVCRKINRTYNIGDYLQLKRKLDMMERALVTETDPLKKETLQQEVEQIRLQRKELKEKGLQRTYSVFITFEKSIEAAKVLKKFKKTQGKSLKDYIMHYFGSSFTELNGMSVYIERAPEPTDILWENLDYRPEGKLKRRTITKLVAGVLIIFCFALMVFIGWAQGKLNDRSAQGSYLPEILSVAASLLICVINSALSHATRYLAIRERHTSYTAYFTGVARKLVIAQFISTAFTTMFAKVALYNTFGQGNGLEHGIENVNFFGKQGIVESMFYVFISNAFVGSIMNILDPFYYLKLRQREKAEEMGSSSLKMTQKEANILYEQPEMDLAVRNAALVNTMLLISFFAPAIPFALIFGILGLLVSYWVDKYLLLRRYSYPISLQDELSDGTIQQLEWMPLLFGLGNLVFTVSLQGTNGVHIYDIMSKVLIFLPIGLGLLTILSPTKIINAKVFPMKEAVTATKTYDEVRADFPTDYDIQNPVTSGQGLREYLSFLKSKKHAIKEMEGNMRKGALVMLSKQAFLKLRSQRNEQAADVKPKEEEEQQNNIKTFELLDEYVNHIAQSDNRGHEMSRGGFINLMDLVNGLGGSNLPEDV